MRALRKLAQFRNFSAWLLTLGLCAGLAGVAAAQTAGTGSISGTVKDPKGLLVPGATVIVRNVGTGSERTLTTNEAGLYAAPYLQPGRYEVHVSKAGFATVVRKDLNLEVGQVLAVDVELLLRAAQETITVTAVPPMVDTEKSDVSQTVSEVQVENLPLNGRRWDNLVLLTPGVSEDGGFGLVSFRGISALYNNNMVDGADNNQAFFAEARGRTRLPYGYSLDAIKEFNVTTAAYSAEFGRAAGGIVNAVTRSGTNEFHGDAFYFIRDQSFLASDAVAHGQGQPKPAERRQQFGGSFGGPIVHDKLFFFLNYDEQLRNFPGTLTGSPSSFDPTVPGSPANVCVSDPSIASACTAVLAAFKPIAVGLIPRKGNNYIGLGKVDYQINANNHLSGVFNILRWDSPNGIFTSPLVPVTASFEGPDIVRDEFLTPAWNSVITPNLVNEVRFQYGRDNEIEPANHSGPSISISGFPSFGMANFLPRGAFPDEKRFEWADNLSWVRGRHQWKTGLDINYVRDRIQNLFQGGGVYGYFNSGRTNNALAKFVTDLVNAGTSTPTRNWSNFSQAGDPVTGSGKGSFTTTDYNFYVQDNFKWRPSFTLNLGVRYELQTMPSVQKANPLVPETARLNTDTNNVAPRIGFDWDIGGKQKQVLRGGYGIYFGRTQNSSIFTALFQNGIFQQTFQPPSRPSGTIPASCLPVAPNLLFPQPSTAPPFSPIFGGSTGSSTNPTPSALFPSVAAFLSSCPGVAGATGVVSALDPHFVNPIVHEYDVAYERELPWKLVATLNYLGARGNHLPVFVDANLPPPNSTKSFLILDGGGNALAPTKVTVPYFSGLPRPNPKVGVILEGKSVINSWYNGLVVRLRRRDAKGFSFDANFTLSQAIDDGQVAGVNGTFNGTVSPLNPFDLRAEYGRSEIDIRKRFIMNFYWVTPFERWTNNQTAKTFIGGWTISSVIRVQDGRPVTANLANLPFGYCARNGNANSGATCGAVSGFGGFVTGRIPFLERNSVFETPGFVDFDLRVGREFKLTERASMQFVWEAFNLFNRANAVPAFGIFPVNNNAFDFILAGTGATPISGTSTSCPAVGTVSGMPDYAGCFVMRRPPHTPPSSNPSLGPFLTVTSTGNTLYTARQMQFALKFRF